MTPNLSRQQIEFSRAKKKKVALLSVIFVFVYLMALILFGEVSLPHFFSMRNAYRQMKNEIDLLKADNARLKAESEALRSSPEEIENLARESLGMARKGEIIYEFPRTDPTSGRSKK